MEATYRQTWDLDSIFQGGSTSKELQTFLYDIQRDTQLLINNLEQLQDVHHVDGVEKWQEHLLHFQDLSCKLEEASEFIICLNAQDTGDTHAQQLSGRVNELASALSMADSKLSALCAEIPEPLWQHALAELKDVAFYLTEMREKAKHSPSELKEELINDLSINGFHAWEDMYNSLIGNLTVPFEIDGKIQHLSIGQAQAKIVGQPDRDVKKALYESHNETLKKNENLFASILNNIAGYRLQVNKHKGLSESILTEPLINNRMSKQTLEMMLQTIDKHKDMFKGYLKKKAELLNLDKLYWYDLTEPTTQSNEKITYEGSIDFLIKHMHSLNPMIAEQTKNIVQNEWIDAEERANKQPSAFMASFPHSKQSRVFMSFNGTSQSTITLAHELGHAFHRFVLNDVPYLSAMYPKCLGETASTYNERLIADAALQSSSKKKEKMALLETKIQASLLYLVFVPSMIQFERNFYEERKNGSVSAEKLQSMMSHEFQQSFGDLVNVDDALHWITIGQLYSTSEPFYNFPYTFGYLFSTGIYATAVEEGPSFEEKYIALLKDTGRMTIEDLAMKHLGEDLTKPNFWERSINILQQDIEEYTTLLESIEA